MIPNNIKMNKKTETVNTSASLKLVYTEISKKFDSQEKKYY